MCRSKVVSVNLDNINLVFVLFKMHYYRSACSDKLPMFGFVAYFFTISVFIFENILYHTGSTK